MIIDIIDLLTTATQSSEQHVFSSAFRLNGSTANRTIGRRCVSAIGTDERTITLARTSSRQIPLAIKIWPSVAMCPLAELETLVPHYITAQWQSERGMWAAFVSSICMVRSSFAYALRDVRSSSIETYVYAYQCGWVCVG